MRPVSLVIAPYHLGRRAVTVGRGPLRLARPLEAALARDTDVHAAEIHLPRTPTGGEADATVLALGTVQAAVAEALQAGRLPVVLAGNCSTTVAVVAAQPTAPRVVWLDAHADFNTPETTLTGFLDGMGLAMLTGRCWTTLLQRVPGLKVVADDRVRLLGTRDVDPGEAHLLRNSRIHWREADDLDASNAFGGVRGDVHVHLDLDVLHHSIGDINVYRAGAGGLHPHEILTALRDAIGDDRLQSLTVSSFDPTLDSETTVATTAIHLVQSVLRNHGD